MIVSWMLFRSSGAVELARFRLAADGLVADDQGLRRLPGLGRQQGVVAAARGGHQRGDRPIAASRRSTVGLAVFG